MAWKSRTENGMAIYWETVTLPSSATIGYTSEMNFLKPNSGTTCNATFLCIASAVSGTNVDVSLHGTVSTAGTKFDLVADALVADVTNAAKVKAAVVNINSYPAPYYYVGLTADADESANTMTVYVMIPTAKGAN